MRYISFRVARECVCGCANVCVRDCVREARIMKSATRVRKRGRRINKMSEMRCAGAL